MSEPNVNAVRALIADAQDITVARAYKDDPPAGEKRSGKDPGDWSGDALGLPPECPVKPLGVDGAINWCLDPIGQLVAYQKPYGQADTLDLFRGRVLYLYWAWPKWAKNAIVDGWRNEKARECIISACTAKGPWSAVEKVRGRGMWKDCGGSLVVHTGNTLWLGGRRQPPGEIDGHVYPTRPRIPDPWPQPVLERESPAALLKPLLSNWAWARPEVDPVLLLGWIGVALLGAAAPWRSAVYITGDKGSGKSTLQTVIKGVLGDWLIQTTNTTAAGIYQKCGQDCLPVAIDEFEGKVDNMHSKRVLELARQASSGGEGFRGGDRGTGSQFAIRSAFLFSSINTPPMEPQDLSRFALLKLARLPNGQPPPDINSQSLGVVGRMILRRLMSEWPRFDLTLAAFKAELASAGMDGRGQDTFGTLLAAADLIEHDGWNEDRLRMVRSDGDLVPWGEVMAIKGMIEFEDAIENWRLCLNHLLQVPVEAWRNGTKGTIGQALQAYWEDSVTHGLTDTNKLLVQAGVKIVKNGMKGTEALAIPNQSPLVRKLFDGSKWGGESGAGVWSGALRQAPKDEVYQTGNVRIGGVMSRVTLIRLAALYGKDGIMADDDETSD